MKNKEKSKSLIDEILDTISPLEEKRIKQKMFLAAKIEDAMIAKGWNKIQFLKAIGKKNPSIITKWFSGTHNFTYDTLFEIQEVLDITLINVEDKKEEFTLKPTIFITTKTSSHIKYQNNITPFSNPTLGQNIIFSTTIGKA